MNTESCTSSAARSTALALYDFEELLSISVDQLGSADDPAREGEYLSLFAEMLARAKEQRDSAAAFIRYCASQEEFADQEIQRLKVRKERISHVRKEFERWLVEVIQRIAVPDRHGVKRLDGNSSSLRIQRNPESVVITDDRALPVRLKDLVITLPAYVWEGLLQCVAFDDRVVFETQLKRIEVKPDKKAIGAELKAGEPVAGAALQEGAWRVVVS